MDFFSHPSGRTSRNVIIFGADMSSSTKTKNKKKDILILGKDPTQGLEHTINAEKCIQLIFLEATKNFVWACIMMEQIVIYLLMELKFINLKQKILKL